ncbi:sigma-70 family RNA polymerase sigma factor [Glycomyces terrestris]|uniref:sigma-70 family RNA polymerase sigma factor n=1 Tax=Glycomyces terrestris TaxID=2493553 RepID=UPI001315A34A|nr:sigma-70 family RNA polymerase sigma factor [Glycomyces terrestris]
MTREHPADEEDFTVLHARLRELSALPPDSGDRDRLRKEVLHECGPLTRHIAERFALRDGGDAAAVMPVAEAAMGRAVDGYRPGACGDFLTFALPAVLGEVRRHVRDTAWPRRSPGERRVGDAACEARPPRTLPSPVAERSSRKVIDAIRSDELGSRLRTEPRVLAAAMAELPEPARRLLELRFVEGRSTVQIGEITGTPQMHVTEQVDQALRELRARLAAADAAQRADR